MATVIEVCGAPAPHSKRLPFAKRTLTPCNFWRGPSGRTCLPYRVDLRPTTSPFARAKGSIMFNHNLRTVVIDASGKGHKIFIGNAWKADALVEDLVKAAQVK